jgi:hypothetical protein
LSPFWIFSMTRPVNTLISVSVVIGALGVWSVRSWVAKWLTLNDVGRQIQSRERSDRVALNRQIEPVYECGKCDRELTNQRHASTVCACAQLSVFKATRSLRSRL